MASKVTQLRKEGKIEEALALAQENYSKDSNNIWNSNIYNFCIITIITGEFWKCSYWYNVYIYMA